MSSDPWSAPVQIPSIGNYPEGIELQTFKGNCHCHKFSFDFVHPPLGVKKPVSCNCTLCTRTGAINIFGRDKFFHLTDGSAGWDEFSKYKSKTWPTTHHFCPDCGSWMFWAGMGLVGVNIRMIDGIEVENLEVNHLDGRSR
ncbi:hypothetical protein ACEPAI_2887 [Sanghuangporus weigelae]